MTDEERLYVCRWRHVPRPRKPEEGVVKVKAKNLSEACERARNLANPELPYFEEDIEIISAEFKSRG